MRKTSRGHVFALLTGLQPHRRKLGRLLLLGVVVRHRSNRGLTKIELRAVGPSFGEHFLWVRSFIKSHREYGFSGDDFEFSVAVRELALGRFRSWKLLLCNGSQCAHA